MPLIRLLSGAGHKYKDKLTQSCPVFRNMLSSACALFQIVSVCCTCGRNDSCDVSECGSDYRRSFIRQPTKFCVQPHVMTLSPTLPFKTFFPSSNFFFPFYPTQPDFWHNYNLLCDILEKTPAAPFHIESVPVINTCKLLKLPHKQN